MTREKKTILATDIRTYPLMGMRQNYFQIWNSNIRETRTILKRY